MTYNWGNIRAAFKDRESWWGLFVVRPLASPIAWLLANFLPIRPEAICLVGLGIGLMAIPFFLLGDHQSLLVGAGLALLSNVLDATDGLVARMTGRVTILGGYIDLASDLVKHTCLISALTLGQLQADPHPIAALPGLCALAFFLLLIANENLLGRLRFPLPINRPPPRTSRPIFPGIMVQRVAAAFAHRNLHPVPTPGEASALILVIAPAFGEVQLGLLAGATLLFAYMLARTVQVLLQTRWLTVGVPEDSQRDKLNALAKAPRA
jgi:phosphatidylglycerophosphate synthase